MFNKAVIKRFNEETSCAPPPTKYDPKTPHGSSAKDINFGLYSGRKEDKIFSSKDGFVTPAKPSSSRGRSMLPASASASVRSCSGTRLRKGTKSSSTKSLQEIPVSVASEETDYKERCINEKISEIEELNTQIKAHMDMYEEMRTQFENEKLMLTSQNADITERLAEVTTKCDKIEQEISAQKAHYDELQYASGQKIEQLEDELNKQEHSCQDLKAEILRLQGEKQELQEMLSVKESVLTELQSEMANLREHMQNLTRTKEEVEANISALHTELENEHTNFASFRASLEMEKAQLVENVASLSQAVSELTSQNEELVMQYNMVTLELSSATSKIENHVNEIQTLSTEVARKQETITLLESKIEEMKSNRDSAVEIAEKTLAEVQSAKEDLQKQYEMLTTELQGMKAKAEVDASNIQALNMDVLNQREKFVEMQSVFEDQKLESASKIQQIEQELNNITSSYKTLQEQHDKLKKEYLHLVENTSLQIELLEDERKNHEEMCGILASEKQRLQSEGEEIRQTLAQKELRLEELETQIVSSNDKIQQLLLEKENKGALMKSLEDELKCKSAEALELQTKLEEEKAESQTMCQQLEQSLADFTTKHNKLADEHHSLSAELSMIKSEAESHVLTIASLNAEIEAKQQTILQLEVCIVSDKAKREEEIRASEKIIADLQSANGELQQQYITLNDEVTRLKAQTEEDTSILKILNIQLTEQQTTFAEMQSRLEEEKNGLALDNAEVMRRLKENLSSYNALVEEYDTLKLKCEMLEKETELNVRRFNEEREQNENMICSLKSENQQLRSDAEHLQQEAATAQMHWNELSTVKSENAILKDHIQNTVYQAEKDREQLRLLTESVEAYRQREQEILQRESQRESLEKKIHELMLENRALKENLDQYKSVYGDYANLASHQNSRQKIKHIVNIKEENIKLRDENAILRQKLGECKEKLRQADKQAINGPRRFDPSQAFKTVLKEPFIQDDRDVRGPDARSTFTVPKKNNSKPVIIVDSKQQSKQGMAFDITFTDNKEN